MTHHPERPCDGDVLAAPMADRLLMLAAKLFRERGYAATTTRELSAQLGVQKASLYHHIKGKEDLLFAISIKSLSRINETVQRACEGVPADGRLEAVIGAHVQTALDDRDLHTTMLVEMRSLSDNRRAVVLAQRREYERFVESIIHADQRANRLRNDISARLLTLSLLNLLNWTIFWYDPVGPRSPAEIGAILHSVYFDGARTPETPCARS